MSAPHPLLALQSPTPKEEEGAKKVEEPDATAAHPLPGQHGELPYCMVAVRLLLRWRRCWHDRLLRSHLHGWIRLRE